MQSLVYFYLPFELSRPSIADEWITPPDPQNTFTDSTLGIVADLWAPFLENYNPISTLKHSKLNIIARQRNEAPDRTNEISDILQREDWSLPFILTTVSMHLEVKRQLPSTGMKWLFVRAHAKAIEESRLDVGVLIMNEEMDLVALSYPVALAARFDAERRDSRRFERSGKL